MTDHRIDSMRANADFLEERGCSAAAFVLRREAEQIEREQSDEKRIDAWIAGPPSTTTVRRWR